MVTQTKRKARIGHCLLINESTISRSLIKNKNTASLVAQIGMVSRNILVMRQRQIIVWTRSNVKDFFLYGELLSCNRASDS